MGNTQANQKEIFQDNTVNLNDILKDDPVNTLLVNSYTWSKDSHGLYDYEGGNNIKKQHIKITTKSIVQRKNDQMQVLTYDQYKKELEEDYKSQQQPILGITQTNNNEYYLKNFPNIPQNPFQALKSATKSELNTDKQNDNSMWLIVRSLKQVKGNKFGCQLQEGDYIKLGRIKFRIREISSSQNKIVINKELSEKEKSNINNSVLETNRNPVPEKANQKTIKKTETQGTVAAEELQSSEQSIKDEGKNCRICYSDTYKKDNPLLTPCKCSGSVQHVHIKCLQQWLQNKITTKSSPYSTAYMWKNLQCELCGFKYPHIFKDNGNSYHAFEMKKPSSPYIIMEFLSKDNNECKGVHIISMHNKNQIKIGRGSDSDMKVTDISVSRCHGFINYQNGNFYLQDHNSKFGTLALIKNGINISPETNKIAIQVNRTVLYFYMKTQKQLPLCCGAKSQKNQNFMLNPKNFKEKHLQLQKENIEISEKIRELEQQKFLKEKSKIQSLKKKLQPFDILNFPVEEEKQQEDRKINLQYSQQINSNDIKQSNLRASNLQLDEKQQKLFENYQRFNKLFPPQFQSKSEIKYKNLLKKSQANQNYINYNDIDLQNLPEQIKKIQFEDQKENEENKNNQQNQKNSIFHNYLNKSEIKDDAGEEKPEIEVQKQSSEQINQDRFLFQENLLKNPQKNPENFFISTQMKNDIQVEMNEPQYPNGQFNEIQDLNDQLNNKNNNQNIDNTKNINININNINNCNNQLYDLDQEENDENLQELQEQQSQQQQQQQEEFNQQQNQSQKKQLGRHIPIKKMSSNFNPKDEIIQFQD